MELLAPVGNIENFHVALDAGADAVYVGAPGFNARNLVREVRIEEIAAMIARCRAEGKKLYIAANSLILEKELRSVIEHLAVLDSLKPDALIVQDLGLIRLIHEYFPGLEIHGSTLTTAHNLQTVEVMGKLGCDRVVLARELTLKEIEVIASRVEDIELEIFIHGAMCFSYSGLCLFSSYLGGKSGLRGNCVQPCRRGYTYQKSAKGRQLATRGRKQQRGAKARPKKAAPGGRPEYLFSMNDLAGLEVVPMLKDFGIASLKIEGRLRSARYIKNSVRAYRMMIDAKSHEQEEVFQEASRLVSQAMSRKTTSGYFFSPQPKEAITHLHSGNMGLHLGRFQHFDVKKNKVTARLKLKEDLSVGDRVRLHIEPGGDRLAFSLKELNNSSDVSKIARAGDKVLVRLPDDIREKRVNSCDLYKVDGKKGAAFRSDLNFKDAKKSVALIRDKRSRLISQVCREVIIPEEKPLGELQENVTSLAVKPKGAKTTTRSKGKRTGRRAAEKNLHKELKLPLEWWLRLDSVKTVLSPLPFTPDRFLLAFEPQMIRQAAQIKGYLGRNSRQVIWALPPLIADKDMAAVRKSLKVLIASGYRTFQVGHISQIELFARERVLLYGDYSLNMLNAQSLLLASQLGLEGVQFSMETDRENLFKSLSAYREISSVNRDDDQVTRIPIGFTVYGTPPLYTARLASSHFQFDRTIVSPKNEPFVIRKKQGYTQTHSTKPFSLLSYLHDLKDLGVNYIVVDLTGGGGGSRAIEELAERFSGTAKGGRLPTFNYLGTLG